MPFGYLLFCSLQDNWVQTTICSLRKRNTTHKEKYLHVKKSSWEVDYKRTQDTHTNSQAIYLKTVWPLTRSSYFTMENITPALCLRSCAYPFPTSPLPSACHHSLTTDQSPRPYVVMSCSLRVRGMGWLCPSAPVCGTFLRFNICMAVRRTIKPNLSLLSNTLPERKKKKKKLLWNNKCYE